MADTETPKPPPVSNPHTVQIILSQMPKQQEKDAIEVRRASVNHQFRQRIHASALFYQQSVVIQGP